jgi:glycosyltransferase involved in cell wall biosynthesis
VHPLRFRRTANFYERRVFQLADHIFAVSTPLRDHIVKEATTHRVSVLPNGANPRRFDHSANPTDLRIRLGIDGKLVIGYVGSLRPWHGLDLLIGAFAALAKRVDHVHLLVIGSGSMEHSLKAQVRAAHLDSRVTFTGPVEHQDITSYLAAMNIGVSPKATYYASPMKILEYMAMGLATVAPRMPNVLDIVEDGKNAVLFEPENCESLAATLESVVLDKELAARLGCAARQKIEVRLNWQYNARKVVEQAVRVGSGKESVGAVAAE